MSGWPADLAPTFCDLCGRPHRVDLSGARCNRCVLTHGRPDRPSNPHLTRVEAPTGAMRRDDARYGWASE